MTPDIVYDQLIGAGCARKLIFSWGGNPGVGSLHRFREAVQKHELEIEEHSHAGMANRYVAAASGLPFAVMRGYNGTSLPEHTDTIRPIACPFTGEWLTAVPALDLDVGIIHAQQADRQGNVQLWGQVGVQKETVLGAKRSLVTVEEIVDELEPQAERRRPPALGRDARRARARRREAVLRAGLLRPRQRGLPGVGRGLEGQRERVRRAVAREDAYRASRCTKPDEMMSVTAARALRDVNACFVGIGLPSTGANLARRTHAPDLVLVYEAGAIGAKPPRLPLSIGDGMLGETADAVVGVPEIFNYWVQPGRIDVGFLGAAQIDRYANINTTVIGGDYDSPKVRLPGAGGAPEIAASCGEVIVIVRQSTRAFVEKVDFITSVGHGSGPGDRERLGLRGKGRRRSSPTSASSSPTPRPGSSCSRTCTPASPPSRPRRRPAGS